MVQQILGSSSILNSKVFSWVFLVDWIMVGVVTLFVIFYFNRLIGWILSFLLKFYYWNWFHVEIKVESLQLALLGGRIFFKNLVYVGHNESFAILQGSLTWRYWLRHWRKSQLDDENGDKQEKSDDYESRIHLHLHGFEWFVYNRTPAYDSILSELLRHSENHYFSSPNDSEANNDFKEKENCPIHKKSTSNKTTGSYGSVKGLSGVSNTSSFSKFEKSFFLRLLPVTIRCEKGAVVIGNKDTPHLLVFHIASGTCVIDAKHSKSKLDRYKMIFRTKVLKPVMEFKPNMDYVQADPVLQMVNNFTDDTSTTLHPLRRFISCLFSLRIFRSNKPEIDDSRGKFHWQGLSRYYVPANGRQNSYPSDDVAPDKIEEEYGKYSTLLDAPEALIVYYYDIPGSVPMNPVPTREEDGPDVGNGGAPPQWGVDLIFTECTVHYGPWAERQRVALHEMLIPRNCTDAVPERTRLVGEERIYTTFHINMKFKESLIWRIPTRESSKNNQVFTQFRQNQELDPFRPFGWIELKAQNYSTISFIGGLVSTTDGWRNEILFNLERAQLRSSVNHGLLFEADNHILKAAIKSPLKWNGCQHWDIGNYSRDIKTFFLREHVTLLSDVLNDFSDGPCVPYNFFIPYYIDITWEILEYGIYLNVNDLNIINNPSEFDDNIFVSFQGEKLFIDVHVPMEQVVVIKNKVDFNIKSPRFDLVVDTPPWHTVENFLDSSGTGRAYDFELKGAYTYYKDVADCNTDQILLEATGSNATLILYGFVLKDIINIRDNYFGLTTHFQTLEEYTTNPRSSEVEFTHLRADNDLDVMFFVYVNNGTLLLPANIYGSEENVRLDFVTLDIDVRFTNYYMDIQANMSPIRGKYNRFIDSAKILDMSRLYGEFEPEIFLEGLVICGNRLFGLPPSEPTYFCKWDFSLGDILLNGPLELIEVLGRSFQCLTYTFEDSENAVLLTEPPLYDVTFLHLNIGSIKFKFKTENTGLEIMTSNVTFDYNDLANERYSGRVSLEIPLASLSILGEADKKTENEPIVASFKTSIMLTDFIQQRHFRERRELQQEHIAKHDAPFKRCSFLLSETQRNSFEYTSNGNLGPFPSLPLNTIPPPLNRDNLKVIDPNVNEKELLREEDQSSLSSRSRMSSSIFKSEMSSLLSFEKANTRNYTVEIENKQMEDVNITNDYLPPPSWKKFQVISDEFRSGGIHFDLHPNSYYNSDEAIQPRSSIDENKEYNNLVIQMGVIEGFISPLALTAVEVILKNLETSSVEATIDRLQLGLLKRLRLRHNFSIEPSVVNIRAVIPSINVTYVNKISNNIKTAIEGSLGNHMYVDCKGINFVIRLSDDDKVPLEDIARIEAVPTQKTIYFDIDNLSFGIRRSEHFQEGEEYNPMIFQVDKSEFWWYEGQESFGSLRMKIIDMFIMRTQLDWIVSFLNRSIKQVSEISLNDDNHSKRYQKKLEYVIYELSLAGESYKIEHDPAVLTRPSYVIQSSEHVRASNSWRLLVRLRHILRSVPEAWREERASDLQSGNFDLPDDIQHKVQSLLSKWRSWEMSSIEDTYLFKYVFLQSSLTEHIISITTHTTLDIENIGFRLQYPIDEDYICFDYVRLLVSWKASHSNPFVHGELKGSSLLNIDSTLSCSHIRSRLSHNLLDVAESLDKLDEIPSSSSKGSSHLNNSSIKFSKTRAPKLGLRFNMSVQTVSLSILTPSIVTEFSISQINMAVLTEQLDDLDRQNIIFTLISSFKEFDTRFMDKKEAIEILRLAVISARYSITFKGRPESCSKHIDIHANELLGSLPNDLGVSINLFFRLLESEYHLFDKFGNSSSTSQSNTVQKIIKPAIPLPFFGSLIVRVSSDVATLNLKLLPSLALFYRTKSAKFQIAHRSLDSLFSSIEIIEQNIDLKSTSDSNETNFLRGFFSNFSTTGWIGINNILDDNHSSVVPVEMISSLERLEIKSATIVNSFADFVHILNREIEPIGHLSKKLTVKFNDLQGQNTKPQNQVEIKIGFKSRFSLGRYSIHIPIVDNVIALEGEGLRNEIITFDFNNGRTVSLPLKFGASSNLLQLYLYEISLKDNYSAPFLGLKGSLFFQEKSEYGKDLCELRSDFTKVLLYPDVFARLQRTGKLLLQEFDSIYSNKELISESEAWKDTYDPIRKALDKTIINMTVADFATAWTFENPLENGDGLLFGYKLLEITTKSSNARMKLIDFYVTTTMEQKIFLSEGEGIERPNTAILPNIVLDLKSIWLKPRPIISLRLFGESLRVTLLPSIVSISAKLIKSINKLYSLQEVYNEVLEPIPIQKKTHTGMKGYNLFQLPVDVNFILEFEAAMIVLWEDKDILEKTLISSVTNKHAPPSDLPALALQTPGIKASLSYRGGQFGSQNSINMEILITSSSNTVYPKAVPITLQLLNTINDTLREKHQSKSGEQQGWTQLQNHRGVNTLFANVDMNLGLRFEKQELTLSCLPTVKVAATVSIGNSSLGLNTCNDEEGNRLFCASGNIHDFRIFVQHIYSREYSCSIEADDIILIGVKGQISSDNEPVRISGKLSNLSFELNTKQIQDLEIFQDIWLPTGALRETKLNDKETSIENGEGLVRKYHEVSTTLAIPWSIDLAVLGVSGEVDLGSSVGKVKTNLNEFWVSSRKSSSWEQNLSLEFDTFKLESQGRLGGKVQIDKLRVRTAILWQSHDQLDTLNIPLVQFIIGLGTCEAKLSLDYHYFALASISGLNFSMSNQRDKYGILQDRLFAVGECKAFRIYFTGLAASKFLDIHYILRRIKHASTISYDAILQDSSGENKNQKIERPNGDKRKPLLNLISRLRTSLDIELDVFEILVFPNDFSDSIVLSGHIDKALAKYSQEQRETSIYSTLRLKMTSFSIALSSIRKPFLDEIGLSPLMSFTNFVSENVKGGTIINVPVFVISMDTWQEIDSNIVEYVFNSYLGGRVDIGWNLGSINIIREMWESHARAFSARRDQYSLSFGSNVLTAIKLDENLKDVKLDTSYTYIAREPPIIATPQLRDMGEATPPIEWIGLHRQRLPGFTHQVIIKGLQGLARDVDFLYSRVLGRS